MLTVEIITPEQTVFTGEVLSVSIPTPEGEIGIFDHHIPIVTIVVPGSVVVRGLDGVEQLFAVARGMVEVNGSSIRLLVDTADRAEGLEEDAIRAAKERAEALMKDRREDAEGFAEATAMLERELARLKVARRHRSRVNPTRTF